MRVVFSMDLTETRSLADIGELASFIGLKLRTEFRILFEVLGRMRTRGDKQFRVASTINASLCSKTEVSHEPRCHCQLTYVLLSWRTPSMRSSRPIASASMVRGSNREWLAGTLSREMSSISPRYESAC